MLLRVSQCCLVYSVVFVGLSRVRVCLSSRSGWCVGFSRKSEAVVGCGVARSRQGECCVFLFVVVADLEVVEDVGSAE